MTGGRTIDVPLTYDAHERGLTGDGVTNDQPAFARAVDELGAGYAADGRPRVLRCPPGVYSIRDAGTVWRSGVSLIGAGIGLTRFVLANPGNRGDPTPLAFFTTLWHGAGRGNPIVDCTFAGFEIDGTGVELPEYDVQAKGLGLQYVLRGRFRDLYIHGTAATGLGCDFLQDCVIDGVIAIDCGRLDIHHEKGGAGIGVGIGGWGDVERLTITNCTTVGNGQSGIFFELQDAAWDRPRGIHVSGCHAEGNRFGISDWGADGLLLSGCTLVGNAEAGFDVSGEGTVGVGGRGGIVSDCLIDGNTLDGVSIGNTPGPYTVRGNRISGNGRHGYREHDLPGSIGPAGGIVIDGNDIWANGLDGIRFDCALTDAVVTNNRIRHNGMQTAPAGAGSGTTVTYGPASLTDTAAHWPVDGHRGKTVTAGSVTAFVAANSATTLVLARPHGARHGWHGSVPAAGTAYRLPDPPTVRAGIAVAAPLVRSTVSRNRIWDDPAHATQTHGLWMTGAGTRSAGRMWDNDLTGNSVAPTRADDPPGDGPHG
ncbi:right-handed parallel beta-helix repeat-containing protein [Polymorphospora sp. NPDC050346]|uniref:right-handed parallel beta-helix repeat-containing protein n=1 Tax=Polymorphospora sp. NPDC050346 TaxID=3155780 RepID=UPI0033FE4853